MLNVEYLTQDDFEQLPKFKGKELIRVKNHNLYKRIAISKLVFVEYLATLAHRKGLVLPEAMFGDTRFFNGYVMKSINGSMNVDEYIANPNRPSIDPAAIFKKILTLVEVANRSFVIGDVRNSNILITPNQPYLIDFENGRKLYDYAAPISAFYHIKCDGELILESALTDRIKALISALSMYYNLDLEMHYSDKDIVKLIEDLESVKAPKSILDYLNYLINQAINEKFEEVKPFNNFIKNLEPLSKEDRTRLLVRL